jgi:hypothetical protein
MEQEAIADYVLLKHSVLQQRNDLNTCPFVLVAAFF